VSMSCQSSEEARHGVFSASPVARISTGMTCILLGVGAMPTYSGTPSSKVA
jgi:hypothetical protein